MTERIEAIIDGVIEREGGFVDHADDRGGATRHGITERVARKFGWGGPMAELPIQFARDVYRTQYVAEPGFDRILKIAPAIAEELVDTGVLMGPGTATKFLQRALNALNRQGCDYADLEVDGGCGPMTRAALAAFIQARGSHGVDVLAWLLNAVQAVRFLEIVERDASQESFLFGWVAHRAAHGYI